MIDANHFTCTDLPRFIPELQVEDLDPAVGIETCARILAGFFDAHLVRRLPGDEPWMLPVLPDLLEMREFRARTAAKR